MNKVVEGRCEEVSLFPEASASQPAPCWSGTGRRTDEVLHQCARRSWCSRSGAPPHRHCLLRSRLASAAYFISVKRWSVSHVSAGWFCPFASNPFTKPLVIFVNTRYAKPNRDKNKCSMRCALAEAPLLKTGMLIIQPGVEEWGLFDLSGTERSLWTHG